MSDVCHDPVDGGLQKCSHRYNTSSRDFANVHTHRPRPISFSLLFFPQPTAWYSSAVIKLLIKRLHSVHGIT